MIDGLELALGWVAIPSHSAISNVAVVEKVADDLDALGFAVSTKAVESENDDSPTKLNLVATLGDGPRRLVLSGHSDTVPVGDESLWTRAPYGEAAEERLYGRGSLDMKGPTACAVIAGVEAHRAGELGDLQIVLALSADEEIGHLGAKQFTSLDPLKDVIGVLVVEPTKMSVVHAHKGGLRLDVVVHGKNCHSSQPWDGVNAILQANRFLVEFEKLSQSWNERRHEAFGPDEGPTASVTGIQGFQAANMIPDRCTVIIGARPLCRKDRDDLVKRVDDLIGSLKDEDMALSPDRRFHAEVFKSSDAAPMTTSKENRWYRFVREIRGQQEHRFERYGTDGGVFSELGLSSVICGPGSLAQAHQPDEYITIEALRSGTMGIRQIIAGAAVSKEL